VCPAFGLINHILNRWRLSSAEEENSTKCFISDSMFPFEGTKYFFTYIKKFILVIVVLSSYRERLTESHMKTVNVTIVSEF